jgi:hypothetical protein
MAARSKNGRAPVCYFIDPLGERLPQWCLRQEAGFYGYRDWRGRRAWKQTSRQRYLSTLKMMREMVGGLRRDKHD